MPIVFYLGIDPVKFGLLASFNHPGGNVTGIAAMQAELVAKRIEFLHELVPKATPDVRRVAVITDPDNRSAAAQFAAIQAVAPSLGVDELSLLGLNDQGSIEQGIGNLAHSGNGGLIALRISEVIVHRGSIIQSAALHRLPGLSFAHICRGWWPGFLRSRRCWPVSSSCLLHRSDPQGGRSRPTASAGYTAARKYAAESVACRVGF